MNEQIAEDLVAELDDDYRVSDVLRRPAHLKALIETWQDRYPESEPPSEVTWERLIHDLMMVSRRDRLDARDEHFAPMMTDLDHSTDPPREWAYPDIDALLSDDAAVAYYRNRAETTPNPIRRARYADFVWLALMQRRDPDAYLFGIMAADAYLEESRLCTAQAAYLRLVKGMDRAAEISVTLNNNELAAKVADRILELLSEMDPSVRSRWVWELTDTLLYLDAKNEDLVDTGIWESIRQHCDDSIAICESGEVQNPFFARELLHLASRVADRRGDSAAAWGYLVRRVESLENQSRQRETEEGVSGGKLVAFKFMEDAMRAYLDRASQASSEEERQRLQMRAEDTRREVRRLLLEAESEMKPISVSAQVPRKTLEEYVKSLLEAEPEDTLALLASNDSLLPNIEELRRQAREAAESHVLTSLIGRTTFRDGRKVDEIPPGEGESIQFSTGLDLWFQYHHHLLHFILSRLRQEGRFTLEAFMAHLHRWEFLEAADAEFVEVGLERYFADDHVSAIHVLVPRVEHMLRAAFEQAGLVSVVLPNQRQIREQTFGEFLRREEVRQALGEDIWTYLSYGFVDDQGLNIRNQVAHGWLKPEQCHQGLVQIVLFAILILTRLHRMSETAQRNPDTGTGAESER